MKKYTNTAHGREVSLFQGSLKEGFHCSRIILLCRICGSTYNVYVPHGCATNVRMTNRDIGTIMVRSLFSSPLSMLVAHRDGRRQLRNRIDSAGLVKHPGIRIINRTSDYSTGGLLINRPGYASVRNIYNA